MNDYESLSDFEINKAVAEALGLKLGEDYGTNPNRTHASLAPTEVLGATSFDGCNDPSDAWPIITENRISIEYLQDNLPPHVFQNKKRVKSNCFWDKNPLKAAMIVFLKMQEAS